MTQKDILLAFLRDNPQKVTIHEIALHLYGASDEKTLAKTRVAVSRARVGGKVKRTYSTHTYGATDDSNSHPKQG